MTYARGFTHYIVGEDLDDLSGMDVPNGDDLAAFKGAVYGVLMGIPVWAAIGLCVWVVINRF